MKRLIYALILVMFSGFSAGAQKYVQRVKSASGQITYPATEIPQKFNLLKIDKQALANLLTGAPDQFGGHLSNVVLEIPLMEGGTESFQIYRTHPMSAELENLAPEIKTYRGVNKKGHRLRLLVSPFGVTWEIYGLQKGRAVLQRYDNDDTYIYYYLQDRSAPEFQCEVTESIDETVNQNTSARPAFNDGILRTFRLAFAADGEFSQYHVQLAINNGDLPSNPTDAQKKQAVLNAIVAIIDRVNEVYEVDLAIHLELIPNELDIIYLDPNNDPYSNNSPSTLLSQNQNNLDNVIGSNNYDIGHVGTTGGGGLARIRSVCVDGIKAMGETGLSDPVGDPYAIDFVAHEMGHQFGGNHTFANYCNGNRNDATAVEPGSGTTIMAYAGVCSPNVQDHSDPQFHTLSIDEIWNHLLGHDCSNHTVLTNQTPTVTLGPNKYIPLDTPFMIPVSASDTDTNDLLTFTWDETDVFQDSGQTDAPPSSNNTSGPLFRSLPATSDTVRFFPRIQDVLNGNYGNTWEVLPAVERILSFTVTVRDNVTPGGQIARDEIILGAKANTGPFRVTSHSTATTLQPGQDITVTWNVAGTDANNINCSTVDILLSLDGGETYPVVLAYNTPNDGSETVTIPSTAQSPSARYMVKAHDNYFFDVNHADLTIGNYTTVCNDFSTSPSLPIPDGDPNGITSTIDVNQNISITDLNVTVNISHTWISDLIIRLTSPQGTTITLFNRNCYNEDNINTVFDDEGSTMACDSINAGNHYQPVDALSAFDGEDAQGTWTLFVSDNANQDSGTLNSWNLNICTMMGVEELNPVSGLQIYPNPADEFIRIQFFATNSAQKINITDLNGRLIYQTDLHQSGETTQEIRVKDWAKGVYILHITDGDKQSTRKIIVE